MCLGLQRISSLWVEEEEVHRKAQNASWKTDLQRWCSVMHRHRDTERSLGASVFISLPYLFQMLWVSTSVGAFCVFCFTQALYCEYIIVFTRSSNSKLKDSSSITQVMCNEQAGSFIWAALISYVTVGCLRWAALFSYLLMSVSGERHCSHMSLLGVSGEQHCSHIYWWVSQVSSIVLICHSWVSQVSSIVLIFTVGCLRWVALFSYVTVGCLRWAALFSYFTVGCLRWAALFSYFTVGCLRGAALFSYVTVGCLSWATLFLYVTVGCVSVYRHCSYMNQLSGFDLIRLWDWSFQSLEFS
jgi:hypothetical protein